MKKILIIKHGSLGDIVFALPAIHSICEHFSKSHIDLLTQQKYFSFLKPSRYFKKFIEDNRSPNPYVTLKILLRILINRYDLVIDLQNSSRTSYYNFFLRMFSKSKISSSRKFSHFKYIIPIQGVETSTQGLFNQIKILNIKEISNIKYNWLVTKLEPKYENKIVLFIPGVSKGGEYKQWDPNKLANIAKYCEDKKYNVCVVGTSNDHNSILPILKKCKNIINKIDISPPDIIYSIACRSTLIITNDTGPGHVAALSGSKILWLINDNNISKANISENPNNFKILTDSIKNLSVKEVIYFIDKNNLL